MNAVQKLRQMIGEVRKAQQPAQLQEAWELIGRLLGRMPVPGADAERVCADRDVEGLERLVAKLEGPMSKPAARAAPAATRVPLDPALEREMEQALRAFKKRLKLSRLSDESKLRGRRLTGGHKSEIDAIIPPTEFPVEIWNALAKAGKLKYAGEGFYALP